MKVMLDNFTFSLGPEKQIDFTGPRVIAKLDIPGAPPIYQDMGEDEHTYAWSGVLQGDNAEKDCNAILKLKEAGSEVKFLAGMIDKKVRIREFNYSYVRSTYIRYSITLIEIQNEPQPFVPSVVKRAAPVVPKPIAPPEPDYYTYTMKSGDTLWALAVKYYSNGNSWPKIANASGISNPRRIPVGYVVKIPKG
ncbi:LysM peptidoglycan-binding domain-containing protein [Clostridium lundense]|uniref:LysM peptidoglycan-binding domain-containing protein n=1 Tax=Clostridium lundense TaxID=319475 RepID=UPI00047F9EB5|nr:LysM peptidoglycan-binding domain-containing protein [Clostridium lundense]